MKIKVLGPGCTRCHELHKRTTEVVAEMGIDAEIEYVKDINKIMEYPILTTPGLVIDEELVVSGRVPAGKEISKYISDALQKTE